MIIYPYFNGYLRLKSWDFAFMLGLANMNGTWDLGPPCEPALSWNMFYSSSIVWPSEYALTTRFSAEYDTVTS